MNLQELLQLPRLNNEEEWANVNESELYAVSSHGRVWSAVSDRLLSATADRKGYLHVSVGGRSTYLHRLVANAFVARPNGRYNKVKFKDNNNQNVRADNLYWSTGGSSALSLEEQQEIIRLYHDTTMLPSEIAEQFEVSQSTVYRLVRT